MHFIRRTQLTNQVYSLPPVLCHARRGPFQWYATARRTHWIRAPRRTIYLQGVRRLNRVEGLSIWGSPMVLLASNLVVIECHQAVVRLL